VRTERVEEIVRGYLGRMPAAAEAHELDAQYRLQMDMLRRILGMVDIALDDEGIPRETRDRVLRAALYGSVDDPGAAMRRQEEIARLRAELARWPVVLDRIDPRLGASG
jgi:hypothetical protein